MQNEILAMLAMFILVLVAAFFVSKFLATKQGNLIKGKNLEVIETCNFMGQKSLAIVRAGKKYFVVAMTKDSIVHLTDLGEDEMSFEEETAKVKTTLKFSDILQNYKGGKR